jgi:hypothetical protein
MSVTVAANELEKGYEINKPPFDNFQGKKLIWRLPSHNS